MPSSHTDFVDKFKTLVHYFVTNLQQFPMPMKTLATTV